MSTAPQQIRMIARDLTWVDVDRETAVSTSRVLAAWFGGNGGNGGDGGDGGEGGEGGEGGSVPLPNFATHGALVKLARLMSIVADTDDNDHRNIHREAAEADITLAEMSALSKYMDMPAVKRVVQRAMGSILVEAAACRGAAGVSSAFDVGSPLPGLTSEETDWLSSLNSITY